MLDVHYFQTMPLALRRVYPPEWKQGLKGVGDQTGYFAFQTEYFAWDVDAEGHLKKRYLYPLVSFPGAKGIGMSPLEWKAGGFL